MINPSAPGWIDKFFTEQPFSEELSFNQKIITEARLFEAPVLPRLKLKSVKILGLAAA